MGKFISLIGKRFGRLTVIKRVSNKRKRDGTIRGGAVWECLCDCGNSTIVSSSNLQGGNVLSCGCYKKEIDNKKIIEAGHQNKKYNTYDLSEEFGIGYTAEGKEFYFDKEDFDKIKDNYWTINKNGYVISKANQKKQKCIWMHRLVMGLNNPKQFIDHIIPEHKNDNRKTNLRIVTKLENSWNRPMTVTNKSGVIGVHWDKKSKKWRASISVNNKKIYLGEYKNIEEAIKARKDGEIKYHGEYRYKGDKDEKSN